MLVRLETWVLQAWCNLLTMWMQTDFPRKKGGAKTEEVKKKSASLKKQTSRGGKMWNISHVDTWRNENVNKRGQSMSLVFSLLVLICLFRYRWDGKKWGRKNTWDWWKIQDPNRVTAVVTLTPPAGKLRSIIFPLMWLIYFQDCRRSKSRCTRLRSCWWITVSHVSVITSSIQTILHWRSRTLTSQQFMKRCKIQPKIPESPPPSIQPWEHWCFCCLNYNHHWGL